jgi:phosphoglycolate phosphatase-like HAD superfamily hydrolase
MKELEELEINDMFSIIVGYEDVPEPKPDPSGMILALNSLGVQPQEALFVGDSLADITASRAAGCWCCHATWRIPENQTQQDIVKADFTAVSPDDIVGLVCPG